MYLFSESIDRISEYFIKITKKNIVENNNIFIVQVVKNHIEDYIKQSISKSLNKKSLEKKS